jgi:pimeloyl-ACP methyl ester carboxylesterase
MVINSDAPADQALNVLILHGGWQNSWWWQPVAGHLRRLGHRCWTPDLPGCAPGDPTTATVTLRSMADSVIDLIRATPAMQDLVLVVHSGGGPVGQLVAAAVPERIAAMTFVDAWVLVDGECIADLLPPALAPIVEQARRGAPIPMDPGVWFDSFAQDASESERLEGGPRVASTLCPPDWVIGVSDWQPFWDVVAAGRIEMYYLFLDADKAVPSELYWQMAQRLGPAAIATTPGSHQGFHRYYRECTDALVQLASQQRPGST